MKRVRLFMLTALILIITVSCDNKDVTDILTAKKHSFDKIMAAYLKFENTFMLYEDIFNNGSIDTELFLTGYDMHGSTAESFLKSASPILDLIIQKQIGFKSSFINDSAAKEFKYFCSLEHFLKTEEETPVTNIIIGQKDIKAAIPVVYNKTFSLPVNGIGKMLYMIEPRDAFLQFDIDFSYTMLKQLYAPRPDTASQKRYNDAYKILYKNATIKKNGDTYSVTFNNDSVLMHISALVKAIKNDSRLKAFCTIYEKAFTKELKVFEETFNNSDIKKKIRHIAFTEELTVRNGLVAKNTIHAALEENEFLRLEFEVGDYENPIGTLNCALNFSNPKPNNNEKIITSFKSKGFANEREANIDYSFTLAAPNITNQPFSEVGMHCYFYADTQKLQENFKTGVDVKVQLQARSSADKRANNKLKNIDFAMQAAGDIKKAKDSVTYTINSIGLDIKTPTDDNIFMFKTDATVVLNKKISTNIEMPKETVYVLETKNDEWKKIQEEIGTNLMEMGSKTNF